MPELVTIPSSFFEVSVDYDRPVLKLLLDRGLIVQGIFDALKPWNPSIDDIEPHNDGKHSEQGVTFRIPTKRASFFLGIAFCRFSREDVDWAAADETINMIDTIMLTLCQLSGIVMGTPKSPVGMHLQPRTKNYLEVLAPFLAAQWASFETAPVRRMAVIARWEKRGVTLDGSTLLANAVFAKLEREFEIGSTWLDMASQLRIDQEELFRMLGVEEDRG